MSAFSESCNPSAEIIPPEAPPDNPNAPHQDHQVAEFHLAPFPFTRADQPAPVQLETRGITSHPHTPPPPTKTRPEQSEFWTAGTIHKNAIAAKLRESGRGDLAQALEDCHSHYTVAHCNDCGKVTRFPNRCDRFYCPECQPRLAYDRRRSVEWWTKEVSQPKHVVLTIRNVPQLLPEHVDEFKGFWSKLRRRKFARGWRGGFYSLEVTNEGRGWHLHLHALIDARWIDAAELARQWSDCCRGFGNIVKVKDAREQNYLAEVTKYAVKGSQLAEWTPADIVQFITAFAGKRTFGVFGTLYGKRTEFAEWLAQIRDQKPLCPCGSCNVAYFSEHDWLLRQLKDDGQPLLSRPPPRQDSQVELALALPTVYPR